MKRAIVLIAAVAAAGLAAPAAQASHICVTMNDEKIVCDPDTKEPEPICVVRGDDTIICVP